MFTEIIIVGLLLWLVNNNHLGFSPRAKIIINRTTATLLVIALLLILYSHFGHIEKSGFRLTPR